MTKIKNKMAMAIAKELLLALSIASPIKYPYNVPTKAVAKSRKKDLIKSLFSPLKYFLKITGQKQFASVLFF